MANEQANVTVARRSWGEAAPEWIIVLAEACDRSNQAAVSRQLGVSGAQVNQVLRNTYAGRLDRLEQKVRGTLMNECVACPVLGEITRRRCIDEQGRDYAATNALRVELRRACKTCANRNNKAA